jgi:sec-independent protein translocase protein TatB
LPEAIRGVAQGIGKLRKMAGEFRSQADELVREANLDEVRNSINEIRNFNIRGEIEKAVDADGSIRKTFTEDPLKTDYSAPAATPAAEEKPAVPAPAFVPPAYASHPPASVIPAPPPAPAPAFVPPAEAGITAPPPPTTADFASPPPATAAGPEPAPVAKS